MTTFKTELQALINRHSVENASDTPDFILAGFIMDCLHGWETATRARDEWGRVPTTEGATP